MSTKELRFISEEDELRKFPMTDKQFTDGSVIDGTGFVWTPRELSDHDIEVEIDRITYRIGHPKLKLKPMDHTKLEALVGEQRRRQIRCSAGVDPEIGKENAMKKAKEAVAEKIAKEEAKHEDLYVEVRTASGAIWGRTVLRPCRFKTGSTGYTIADRYRNPENFTAFQFNANLVRVGSKPAPEACP